MFPLTICIPFLVAAQAPRDAPQTATPAVTVTGRDAIALVIGNTLDLSYEGHRTAVYFEQGGAARYREDRPDAAIVENRWSISDDGKLCTSGAANPVPSGFDCGVIRVSGDRVLIEIDRGRLRISARLLRGNPYGL